MIYNMPTVSPSNALTSEELAMFGECLEKWNCKLSRNYKRMRYYEGKNRLRSLGIAIPPIFKDVETVVGWPTKAVDYLSSRVRFDGFTFHGGYTDQVFKDAIEANNLRNGISQATTSELIHSCAFVTLSKGDVGEPPVVISEYSAVNGAVLWDYRRKRVKCGITIVDIDKQRQPNRINLYTDDAVIILVRDGNTWSAQRLDHDMGRPLIEPLVHKASLDKPLGKSRISRAVMSITDSGVREVLRTEISSEFFTTPQRYVLGADESLFADTTKWEAYIGNFFALGGADEDGNMPQVGQFPQMSMQPHTDYLRSLASQFAGETSIPVNSLGIIHDNPASAEAMNAANEDLIIEAQNLIDSNGSSLRNIALMAMAIIEDVTMDELTDDQKGVMPSYKNPAMPSIVSQADAWTKIVSVAPDDVKSGIFSSDIFWEQLGFSEDQRDRIMKAMTKASATATINSLMNEAKAVKDGTA